MAEKLVSIYDQPDAEVMLEVEVLEVARSRLRDLGIQFPSQLSLSPLASSSGTLTLKDLLNLNRETIQATIDPLHISANTNLSDVNVLANPRIRSRNHEKAKIQVGQRVPNITSTSTSTGFVAESVQYVDVGLKVEVEPSVSPDNEVAIKISLEVSNILNQIQTKSGSIAYEIGTRNATTVLRLRDGENQVLAGLINDEDRRSGNRIPGIGEVPGLGRLFGASRDEFRKSEIILSITPHIIRAAPRISMHEAEFDSGTEANLRARLLEGASPVSGAAAQATSASGAPSPSGQRKDSSAQPPGTNSPNSSGTSALPGSNTGISDTSSYSGSNGSALGPGGSLPAASLAWSNPTQASVGNTWPVQLILQSSDPVTSIPFNVTFDPDVLELVSIEQGDFMSQNGAASTLSNRIDNTAGSLNAVINATDAKGAAGTGILATLTFKPKQAAASTRVQIADTVTAVGQGGKAVMLGTAAPLVAKVQ
jgi:general secretion pathway protein D